MHVCSMSLGPAVIYGGPIVQIVHLIYFGFSYSLNYTGRARGWGGDGDSLGSLNFMDSYYLESLG